MYIDLTRMISKQWRPTGCGENSETILPCGEYCIMRAIPTYKFSTNFKFTLNKYNEIPLIENITFKLPLLNSLILYFEKQQQILIAVDFKNVFAQFLSIQ